SWSFHQESYWPHSQTGHRAVSAPQSAEPASPLNVCSLLHASPQIQLVLKLVRRSGHATLATPCSSSGCVIRVLLSASPVFPRPNDDRSRPAVDLPKYGASQQAGRTHLEYYQARILSR